MISPPVTREVVDAVVEVNLANHAAVALREDSYSVYAGSDDEASFLSPASSPCRSPAVPRKAGRMGASATPPAGAPTLHAVAAALEGLSDAPEHAPPSSHGTTHSDAANAGDLHTNAPSVDEDPGRVAAPETSRGVDPTVARGVCGAE